MLANNEIKSLIIAMGMGVEVKDISKLLLRAYCHYDRCRRGRSAHPHFAPYVLYRYFQEMVDAGHLYIAQPLFKVSLGKESCYAFNDAEKTKYSKSGASIRRNWRIRRNPRRKTRRRAQMRSRKQRQRESPKQLQKRRPKPSVRISSVTKVWEK